MSEKPKYVMATILMPIEVRDLEEEDFVCLQERARVSLTFCQQLPDVAGEGEGYGGLSDKIRALYDTFENPSLKDSVLPLSEIEEKKGEKKGENKEEIETLPQKEKRNKKNITYRSFRENEKSHRYTFRHLG